MNLSSNAPNRINSSPTKFAVPGHREVREREDQEQRGEHGRAERHPAHPRQELRAAERRASAAIAKKSAGRDEAVVDHLHHGALRPLRVEREDPEQDEAELRDRGVADDQPRVVLRERDHRPVEDRDHREGDHHVLEVHRRVGQDRQHDPQEAVDADLRDDAENTTSTGRGPRGRRRASSRAAGRPAPSPGTRRRTAGRSTAASLRRACAAGGPRARTRCRRPRVSSTPSAIAPASIRATRRACRSSS